MESPEINLTLYKTDCKIVIVGLPGTGKTRVADKIHTICPDYKVFRSDDYIGITNSTQKLINDLVYYDNSKYKIVEGIACYKLLIECMEAEVFWPDVVINVLATSEVRGQRRPDKDYGNMDSRLRMLWMEYNRMPNPHPPRLIEILNS